jgi:uncharacterized protein YkwD
MTGRTLTCLAALGLAAAASTPAAAAAAAAPCASDVAAIVCAVNARRAAHGLPAVRANRSLAGVARAHSADMVASHSFSHGDFGGRIARTAWARRRRSWAAGEALAWGTGERATPAATVTAWMRSPEHRRILLDPRYRVVGVGEAAGVPVAAADGGDGRTYTADFGT